MYIQNMSMEEMAREYRADLPEIEEKNERVDGSAYTTKLLDKARRLDKCCFTRYYVTERGNKYINVFQYVKSEESTRRSVKWNWSVRNIALMQTYKGLAAIVFFDKSNVSITFQYHFFIRYKERLLETCDWQTKNELLKAKTVEEIIAVWAKRNPDIIWINTKAKFGDKEHIFAPINDGVVLMQWDGNHIQANTFITDGMYSNKQLEMLDQAECAVQEAKENQENYNAFVELINQEATQNNQQ